MAVWSVNLEGGTWWYAHVSELPGCFTRAATREGALELLPGAVEAHLRWLEDRGLGYLSRSGFVVVDEQHGVPQLGESGGAVALFNSDREPVTEEALGEFLALMIFNREETLRLVGSLSPVELAARPRLGKRTVVEDVRHVANAEEWYVSRLGRRYQQMYEVELHAVWGKRRLSDVERLTIMRGPMVAALGKALSDGHQGPFARRAFTRHPEEMWTLRKVLRRFVEHEREHIGTIGLTVAALHASHPLGGLDP